MNSVSTHVLDMQRGKPAAGVAVVMERMLTAGSAIVARGTTDADGRIKALVPDGELSEGTYRITFDTGGYFTAQAIEGFYPEASIVFVVRDASSHYHIPLLLAPYGYSTYRGS